MSLFNFKKKSIKQNNKLSFFVKKHKVSFLAYELLKKYVVNQNVSPEKLDCIHPNNWKPRVLKKISSRATKTLRRLSSENKKNSIGKVSQNFSNHMSKEKISKKEKDLLKKIQKDESRYEHIDFLIKKYKINKALK